MTEALIPVPIRAFALTTMIFAESQHEAIRFCNEFGFPTPREAPKVEDRMHFRKILQQLTEDTTWWVEIQPTQALPMEGSWTIINYIRLWLKRYHMDSMAYFEPTTLAVITRAHCQIMRYDQERWPNEHVAHRELLDIFDVKFQRERIPTKVVD